MKSQELSPPPPCVVSCQDLISGDIAGGFFGRSTGAKAEPLIPDFETVAERFVRFAVNHGFTIMRIAGHSSVAVSQRYVHPSPESVERVFERFETMQICKALEIKESASESSPQNSADREGGIGAAKLLIVNNLGP